MDTGRGGEKLRELLMSLTLLAVLVLCVRKGLELWENLRRDWKEVVDED